MDINKRRNIKVVRIIARLNIGGPAIHTILLTEGLKKEPFDSILVTGTIDKDEGDMLYFAKTRNIQPIIIAQLQRKINLLNDTIAFIKIFLLLKRERPDIVHTHTAKAGTLGRLAGLLYNIVSLKRSKLIHTFHGTVLEGYFGRLKTMLFVWIERILSYFTDKIVTVSETTKKELLSLKIGNPKKITVIPLGLDIEKLLSIRPHSQNSALRIGIVARLAPIKNHRMFLEAVKLFLRLKDALSGDCQFFIIGDGELRQELQIYALRLGLRDNVQFCGWQQELCNIYNLLDLVVLTSLNEGTPVSLIEAMSAARPIIATDVGGVRDLFFKNTDYSLQHSDKIRIYDNGILCSSSDVSGLAEALSLLAKNPQLREKMGNYGRAFAKNNFSKERLIRDIKSLYNNCLERSGK